MRIQIRFTGRGYPLAAELPSEFELPSGGSVQSALAALRAALPPDRTLPASCLVSVGGEHLGTVASAADRELSDGDELLLIAPMAGG